MDITNSIIKSVHALDRTKERREQHAFKAEGTKLILDTIGAFPLRMLIATDEWIAEHEGLLSPAIHSKVVMAPARAMERMSSMSTAPAAIAVYDMPHYDAADPAELCPTSGELMLALDTIQDPGNLGTIVRTADWYGITRILASHTTADIFSPKAMQATMGAVARTRVIYCSLEEVLPAIAREGIPVYGTFLDGESIYSAELASRGVIITGNEGRGISPTVASTVTHRLFIPPYPVGRPTSESLNAAIATAITVSEFRRRLI